MMYEMLDSRKVEFGSKCPNGLDSYVLGWMAPDGSFYYTTYMEHLSFARSAAKLLYGEADNDQSLYRHGWLAIHPYGIVGTDYLFSWRGHLSAEQKRAIKPFVEKYKDWIADLTKYDLFDELDVEYDRDDLIREATFGYSGQVKNIEE